MLQQLLAIGGSCNAAKGDYGKILFLRIQEFTGCTVSGFTGPTAPVEGQDVNGKAPYFVESNTYVPTIDVPVFGELGIFLGETIKQPNRVLPAK